MLPAISSDLTASDYRPANTWASALERPWETRKSTNDWVPTLIVRSTNLKVQFPIIRSAGVGSLSSLQPIARNMRVRRLNILTYRKAVFIIWGLVFLFVCCAVKIQKIYTVRIVLHKNPSWFNGGFFEWELRGSNPRPSRLISRDAPYQLSVWLYEPYFSISLPLARGHKLVAWSHIAQYAPLSNLETFP